MASKAGLSDEEIQRAIETRFTCERCGHCCKGSGTVEVGAAEVDRMAKHLGLTKQDFIRKYALSTGRGQWVLRDLANAEQWCIFLEIASDGKYGCKVNAAKPNQCASFPAKWHNDDSFQTCLGLRVLMRDLRREAKERASAE